VNTTLLDQLQGPPESILVVRVEAAEMDEMGRFGQSKQHQRWLGSALDHDSGKVLA
jgi:hypothetical protein